MKNLFQFIKPYYIPILIALICKLFLLFSISVLASYFIPNARSGLNLWSVWDVPNYLSLASSGYQRFGTEANFMVLLPFMPLLIFLFEFIFPTSFLISGFIVSSVATILLAVLLYKLILLDYSKKIALLTVLMFFIFPTSFFLHIPYSESVFVLLVVATFYFARKKHYWISFIFAGLASFTKIAGLALIPAILLEILIFDKQYFNNKNIYNKFTLLFFGSLLSISGFLIYLFLNYFLWGNFFHFTLVQKQNYYESFSPLGQGLIDAFKSLSWRVGLEKIMLGYAQIAAFVIGLIASVYALLKIRFTYGAFSILFLWFFYSMSFWVCMPRYIVPIFPLYVTLALLSKYKTFKYLWMLVSISLLIYLSFIFVQYGPVL